jgi:hypothetical protein
VAARIRYSSCQERGQVVVYSLHFFLCVSNEVERDLTRAEWNTNWFPRFLPFAIFSTSISKHFPNPLDSPKEMKSISRNLHKTGVLNGCHSRKRYQIPTSSSFVLRGFPRRHYYTAREYRFHLTLEIYTHGWRPILQIKDERSSKREQPLKTKDPSTNRRFGFELWEMENAKRDNVVRHVSPHRISTESQTARLHVAIYNINEIKLDFMITSQRFRLRSKRRLLHWL